MLDWLRSIHEKWSNWCGDRDLEIAIRRHLTTSGYFGQTAKLRSVRLAAVQRPGWLQVYRFDAVARMKCELPSDDDEPMSDPPKFVQLFGLAREDARNNQSTIRTFETVEARRELFHEWSADLVQLRNGRALG
jgi:hypothetical protein